MTFDLAIDSWIWHPKYKQQKNIDKLYLIRIKNPLCFKGQYQEGEKTIQRMGENICKSYSW